MASVVYGSDAVLEMEVNSVYYPVLCALDFTFTSSPEFVEKTSATSGLFREFAKRIEEFSVSLSGLTKIDNSETLSFFYMLQNSVRRTEQNFKITFEDDEANVKILSFTGLIGQMSITGPASDFSNCSVEIKGTGAFTLDVTPPPVETEYDYFSDYWVPTAGNNYLSGTSAVNGYTLTATDVPLEVDVEGIGYDLVNGTPGTGLRECKFGTSPVRITFPSDLVFDGVQRVFVLFKRPT